MDNLDSLLSELGINSGNAITPQVTEENTVTVELPDSTMVRVGNGILDQITRPSEEAYTDTTSDVLQHFIDEQVLITGVTNDSSAQPDDIDNMLDSVNSPVTVEGEPEMKTISTNTDDSARFSGAEWFSEIQNKNVSIIGLGGIGSWLSLLISRLKVRYMYLRDMDTVETVNLAGQLYDINDIGQRKTDAMRNILFRFNNQRCSVYTDTSEFNENSTSPLISYGIPLNNVMLGLDSIIARRNVYNWWKNEVSSNIERFIFIDGRLTADKFQIFAIPSDDKKRMETYEKEWLFPESEAVHLPCSFKQTTYMAAMIASYMCNLFVNFVAESTKPLVPYSIPFMTEFDAQTFEMKTYECN